MADQPTPPPIHEPAEVTPVLAKRASEPMRPLYAIGATVAVAFAIVTAWILQTSTVLCPNDASRWNAVWAMVETGRCSWVGNGPWWTIDRCTYDKVDTPEEAKKARWYSSKPYFMQVILAGIAWPLCRLGHLRVFENRHIVGHVILILVNAVPFAVFLALFGRLLRKLKVEGFALAYCLAAAAAGTYLTSWCITLNNHVLAAFCVFFSLYAGYELGRNPLAHWGWYAAGGFFAGMAAAFETQAAAVLGLVSFQLAYWLWRHRRPATLAAVAGALIPIVAFIVTTKVCTGRWIPFQYTFPRFYEPYWANPTGLDALKESKFVYFFNLTLGHHGFFSLMPIFLLSLVGIVRHLRNRESPLRIVATIIFLASVALIAFNTYKTNNYGGTCQGPRWLFWVIPFWLLMLPAGVEWAARRAVGRWVAIAFLAVSAFSMAYASRMPWSQSWLHEIYVKAGIINY